MTTMPSAALAPLSPKQRQKLAGLAALAFKEDSRNSGAVGRDISFDDWRRCQVRNVTGRIGLRECRNGDYLPLLAHFNDLLGNTGVALNAHIKHAGEPREQALHALYREVTGMKDVLPHAMAYARGFLKRKRGVSLDDADDRAIWHAIFTIRRKAQSLRRKARGGESAADVLSRVLGGRMSVK